MTACRWTIVCNLPPTPRRPSRQHDRQRARVRCVCGLECVIWLEDLHGGRSSGCNSHRCRARYEIAIELERELGSRFATAHKLHDRLARWLSESGRRDRLEMREALAQTDAQTDAADIPPTRACVR